MIPNITNGTITYKAGYGDLTPDDVTTILKQSL